MSAKLGTFLLCLAAVCVLLFARFTDARQTTPSDAPLSFVTPSSSYDSSNAPASSALSTATDPAASSEPLLTPPDASAETTSQELPTSTDDPTVTEEAVSPDETTSESTDPLPPTTSELPTTTEPPTTSELPTTTEPPTTSELPTTTEPPVTAPSTTEPDDPSPPDPNRKLVAFTFDDGPHATLTRLFVDKLKEYNATATFFVVGNRVSANTGPALRYAYDNGCEIGLHSWRHAYYANMTVEEFLDDTQRAADAVNRYLPIEATLLRPPGGRISADQLAAADYSIILWSVDPRDYLYRARDDEMTVAVNVYTIADHILDNIQPGDIVLMHEIYWNSYEAFCMVIEELYARGYELVTVSELLSNPQYGQIYRHNR